VKKIIALALLVPALAGVLLATGCQTPKSPLVDRTWVLSSWRGTDGVVHDALSSVNVTATFDSKTGQVTGSGGVNGYGGAFHVDHLNLKVDSLIHTEMASVDAAVNQQESTFFKAMQAAESFSVGHNTLTITGGGWELDFTEQTG
jgi:heat shock protein HslJ